MKRQLLKLIALKGRADMRFVVSLISLFALQAHLLLGCCALHDHGHARIHNDSLFADDLADNEGAKNYALESVHSAPANSPIQGGVCCGSHCSAVRVSQAKSVQSLFELGLVAVLPTCAFVESSTTEVNNLLGISGSPQPTERLYLLHQVFLI